MHQGKPDGTGRVWSEVVDVIWTLRSNEKRAHWEHLTSTQRSYRIVAVRVSTGGALVVELDGGSKRAFRRLSFELTLITLGAKRDQSNSKPFLLQPSPKRHSTPIQSQGEKQRDTCRLVLLRRPATAELGNASSRTTQSRLSSHHQSASGWVRRSSTDRPTFDAGCVARCQCQSESVNVVQHLDCDTLFIHVSVASGRSDRSGNSKLTLRTAGSLSSLTMQTAHRCSACLLHSAAD